MSLINDMLRDLDQRKASAREPEVLLPKVARSQPATGHTRRVLGAALVAVVAVLVAIAGWRVWILSQEVQAETATEQTVVRTPSSLEGEGGGEGEMSQASMVISDAQPVSESTLRQELLATTSEPVTASQENPLTSDNVAAVSDAPVQPVEMVTQTPESAVDEPVPEAAITTAQPVKVAAVAEPVVVKDEPAVQPPHPNPLPRGERELPLRPVAKSGVMAKTPVLTAEQRDRQIVAEARQLWQAGQTLEAENLLRRHVAEFSESGASRALLSQWLMSSGRDGEAAVLLRDVTPAATPELKMIKARLLLAQGQLQAAVELLETGVPALKDDVAYHVLLAALYSQTGQFEDAVNAYAGLVALNSAKADWWAGLAIALEGDGKVEPARRAYQQAASLNGLHPQLQSYVNARLQALQR